MHVGEEFGLPPIGAKEHCCEESSPFGDGTLPCNKPATRMVKHEGERTYRMCGECAHHNIKNRRGIDMGPYVGGGGSNLPPAAAPLIDPEREKAMTDAVAEWADAAGEWLDRGAITSDEDAGKIADLMSGARKLANRIEKTRVDLKQPHLDAGREIDARFKALTAPLERLVKRVGDLQTVWLKAKKAAAEAEAARQREEAARAAAEAEAARAAAAKRNDVVGEVAAEEAVKAAQEAAKAAAAPVKVNVASASGAGRTVGLRTIRRGKITNLAMAFMLVRDNPAVQEAIQAAVNALIRSKDFDPATTLPGVDIILEEKAA